MESATYFVASVEVKCHDNQRLLLSFLNVVRMSGVGHAS